MALRDEIETQKYIRKANQVEEQYGLPKNMLVGLLHAESRFNPNAVSPAGAIGIAQFMPGTAKDFGINPRNVSQSIDAAGKYLSQNYKKLGDWDDTLRSYNMGLGNVYKWKQGKIKLPKETAAYVGKVRAGMGYTGTGGEAQPDSWDWQADKPYTPPSLIPLASNENVAPEEVEDTPEVSAAKQEIDKATTEQQILQQYFAQSSQPQQQVAQQQQVRVEASPELLDQYNQVSQLVDNPIVQEGRVVNQEAFNKLTKEQQATIQKELDFNQNWYANRKQAYDNQGNPIPIDASIYTKQREFNPVIGGTENYGEYDYDTNITKLNPKIFTGQGFGTVEHEDDHSRAMDASKKFSNEAYNLLDAPIRSSLTEENRNKFDAVHSGKSTKEGENYNYDPLEIHANIQSLRQRNNLKPGEYIDKKRMESVKRENQWILDKFNDEEVRGMLNSSVSLPNKNKEFIGQQGGEFIKDNMGQWKYPGQLTEISSPNITMRGVSEPLIGVSKETGEYKIMLPNLEYYFDKTKNVLEIPFSKLKQNGK